MKTIIAMVNGALMLVITAGVSLALAASMMAPSTGRISGDWDIDAGESNAQASNASSLGSEFFHVQWTAETDRRGQPRLSGYVFDDYGEPATNVELQITALDASGQQIGRVTAPVAGTVPAEGNAYFDVPVPAASSYAVVVDSFEFLESAQGK
jgi:hypothetical protein